MQKSFFKTLGVSFAGLGIALSASAVPIGSAVVGGLLQFDYVNFAGDKEDVVRSSGDVRRADLWVKGDLPKQWSYQLGYDARYNLLNASWIGYEGFEYFWLAIGYVDIPQGLNYWSSYTYNTFMEYASVVTALQPHKSLGLYADGLAWQDMVSYQAAFYAPEGIYEETTVQVRTRDNFIDGGSADQWAVAGRGVLRPDFNLGDVTHFGVSARFEGVGDDETLNALVTTPGLLGRQAESDRNNIFVSTVDPTAGDVNTVTVWGVEFAELWGPIVVQAEYIQNYWNGGGEADSLNFWGTYAQASYVLTGEARSYDTYSGTVGNVQNINEVYGAWELAVRYGYTDLSDNPDEGYDANLKRGTQKDWTLGLNWYIIENVKVQGNFVYAMADYSTEGEGEPHIKGMGIRAQVDF
jgi:phosphate-selective porin OprO/OprP